MRVCGLIFLIKIGRMAEILTQAGFDKLLAILDTDRDRAGSKYESLRLRLIKFFEWRNCERAEELTDTVFDRVMKKIAEGEEIQSVGAYAGGVAQFVFKEECRRRERSFQSIEDSPASESVAAVNGFDDSEAGERARL